MDVKLAYLYGKLDNNEHIYMKAPPGINIGIKQGQCLKLKLALYGLKQAGQQWYMKFREIMSQIGLKRSNFDHAVFYQSEPFSIIFIHVNDMTLVTKTMEIMEKLKKGIRNVIEVIDSGELHWLLGIEIHRSLHTKPCDYPSNPTLMPSYHTMALPTSSHYLSHSIHTYIYPRIKCQPQLRRLPLCKTNHTGKLLEPSNTYPWQHDQTSLMQYPS